MPVPRHPRPSRSRRLRHGLTAALTGALLAAIVSPALPARADGADAAPRLDRADPDGAWAGYSVGRSATEDTDRSGPQPRGPGVAGMDVSGHQGAVDWPRAFADGARFAYVKATEGIGFTSDSYPQQYEGSRAAGMIRGAYHFGLPDSSTGAEQAHYFVDHGGGWVPDGRTLPGALDIESNPYGDECYGLSPEQMSGWIADFSGTYQARTGRFPTIYTTTRWWDQCTGANPDFAANNPLWLARFAPEMGPLPAGWDYQAIWQFNNTGVFPGDQNTFNGDPGQLERFAM